MTEGGVVEVEVPSSVTLCVVVVDGDGPAGTAAIDDDSVCAVPGLHDDVTGTNCDKNRLHETKTSNTFDAPLLLVLLFRCCCRFR